MKPRDGAAARSPQANAQTRSVTGEWDGKVVAMGEDFVELEENTERAVLNAEASVSNPKPTDRRHPADNQDSFLPRERRATVVSNIPAQLAKSMGEIREPGLSPQLRKPTLPAPTGSGTPAAHEPGVPAPMTAEVTRKVDDVDSLETLAAEEDAAPEAIDNYSVELVDDSNLPPLAQVGSLIESARAHIDRGNLGAAVIAADQALAEAAKTPQQADIADLVKTSRPLFDRIFAAYVGLLGQVPVRARSDEQIAGQELGERTEYLLASIDGQQTLEQLAASTGIPPVEAMKIAASLLAAGIVRVS